jgi:peptidoglycan/LPS O-acetylase OafA/YrhL
VGTYRVILALCVVIAHASPLPGIRALDAGLAVKTFFIISGFYMALILAEKYPPTPEGRSLFYTNRLLRIYPMYFLTLLFGVAFYALASVKLGHPADRLQFWVQAWRRGSGGALGLVGLSQLTVVGLDLTPLFGFSVRDGFHLVSGSSGAEDIMAWRFNFLPHCWSIGAELLFYATAPLLAGLRTGTKAALALVAALGIWALERTGTPLTAAATYHVGLLQLPYFLLGMLSYRMLRGTILGRLPRAAAGLLQLAVAALTFSGWPVMGKASGLVYLAVAWTTVPVLFQGTRQSAADRWIGELSYPIYLVHIPVKWVLLASRGVERKDTVEIAGGALIMATLVVATVLVVFVDRPLERLRRRRFERSATPSS